MLTQYTFLLIDLQQQVSAINLDPIQNKLNQHDTLLTNQQAEIDGNFIFNTFMRFILSQSYIEIICKALNQTMNNGNAGKEFFILKYLSFIKFKKQTRYIFPQIFQQQPRRISRTYKLR
jgi:hypothetical protein